MSTQIGVGIFLYHLSCFFTPFSKMAAIDQNELLFFYLFFRKRCVIPLDINPRWPPPPNQVLIKLESQTALTAHLKSQQMLFVFELHDYLLPSSTGILTASQRRTAVTAYMKSKQLLLFVLELQKSLLPSSRPTGILTTMQRQTQVSA